MSQFTPHQDQALQAVSRWMKEKPGAGDTPPVFRLFGYAGTGKTTLAKHIAEGVDGEVKYAAFTGKAASVMRGKGCHGASTIHSLIYRTRESGEEIPSFDLWDEAPASKADLIVIDECSMVDAELGRDLLSFGVPLLVLGDPAQLPPIQGGGFFTEAEPDAMLTEVHRQAQDDPIVRLSMDIRAGEYLEPGRYGETEVVAKNDLDPQRVLDADQVLVGRNATRRAYNARMRERRGFEDTMPEAGDKLVCLRNNRKKALFNGGLWTVKARGAAQERQQGGDHVAATLARRRDRATAASKCRCGRSASPAASSSSTGSGASLTTSSTTAMCSPCTRRRARNGTTWCCSTRALRFRIRASAGFTPASQGRRRD